MNNYVFVYGTLMQGQGNHRWLGKSGTDNQCLGCSETISFYRMVISKIGIPAVLFENPIGTIKGELYKITNQILWHLDALESNGYVYQRVQVKVRRLFGKPSVSAWLYFGVSPTWKKSLILQSGDYRKVHALKGT